jgi:hypothetical protein
LIVDNRIARKIQQNRIRLHYCQPFRVQQMTGGADQRHMQRDKIGVPQNVFDTVGVSLTRQGGQAEVSARCD